MSRYDHLTNLADEKLGAKVLYASDEFFAEKENLLKPGRGVFIPDKYTDRGKWMDGWESRRKRTPGHDWCIIELGARGSIAGFDIDTNHFLGNHPPFASIEACELPRFFSTERLLTPEFSWKELIPKTPLAPGSQNFVDTKDHKSAWTHLRFNIYPDGGVARLKVYGIVKKDWSGVLANDIVDLAALQNGGEAKNCSDMFFSKMNNLLMPGRGVDMGDGWETKRSRDLDHKDWVTIKLGHVGMIDEIIVDTRHFKGNYPDTCSIEAGLVKDKTLTWQEILPKMKLQPDHEHHFKKELIGRGPFSDIRLNIYPDGGVSRLRVMGTLVK